MKSEFKLHRAWRYSLICGVTGGISGMITLYIMIEEFSTTFGLSVFLGVWMIAYLGYEKEMATNEIHAPSKYRRAAVFIGLVSHITSFLFYGFIQYLFGFDEFLGFFKGNFGQMLVSSVFLGLFSIINLFWVSIPMYIITGVVAKKFDDEEFRANGISSEVTNELQKVYNEELDF